MEDSGLLSPREQSNGTLPPVFVRFKVGETWGEERSFTRTFTIGRARDCDVVVTDPTVGRRHAEVRWQDGAWRLFDTGSLNGTYLDGVRIHDARLPESCHVKLGQGVLVSITTGLSPTQIMELPDEHDHYDGDGAGPKTRHFRVEMERVKRRHNVTVGIVAGLLIVSISYAFYQYQQLTVLGTRAEDIFYTMKRFELRIAELENRIASQQPTTEQEELRASREEIHNLEREYDGLLQEKGLYAGLSPQEQAVLRVARHFGECEASMPKDFLAEVNKYIQKWKTTPRLHNSMQRALALGYHGTISNAMHTRNLPKQFFYLALQESDFDPKALGPETSSGYAKGMWQFIPSTAVKYKLKVGPLQHRREFDPDDERFDPIKSTHAAAEYLKNIYLTDAQASGLLVIASYNWGEHRIINKIRELPKNPRERNFWQLLKKTKIPQETHDYVFYIISAAVIGENPQLFGFNFQAPFPSNHKTL